MASTTDSGDDKVVQFPLDAEERKALRKQKQELERQRLIRYFVDETGNAEALFHSRDGTAYADLIIEGNRQTWPVRSRQFRLEYVRFLQRQWEQAADAGEVLALSLRPSLKKAAVNAAIDEFEMRAACSPIERDVHVRVAADGDDLYIDLVDRGWNAIRVTAEGWSVVTAPPVRFRRTVGMAALPFPERGGSTQTLRPFLNIRGHSDFVLVIGFLLAALQPHGPYPICTFIGEQGSAKTTLIRLLRSLVDPSAVPSGSLPLSGRDLFIAAHNSHVQAFENISKLSAAMSDHLCRLSTTENPFHPASNRGLTCLLTTHKLPTRGTSPNPPARHDLHRADAHPPRPCRSERAVQADSQGRRRNARLRIRRPRRALRETQGL